MFKLFKKKSKIEPNNPYENIDDKTIQKVDEAIKEFGINHLFSLSFSDFVEQNKSK